MPFFAPLRRNEIITGWKFNGVIRRLSPSPKNMLNISIINLINPTKNRIKFHSYPQYCKCNCAESIFLRYYFLFINYILIYYNLIEMETWLGLPPNNSVPVLGVILFFFMLLNTTESINTNLWSSLPTPFPHRRRFYLFTVKQKIEKNNSNLSSLPSVPVAAKYIYYTFCLFSNRDIEARPKDKQKKKSSIRPR